MSEGTVPSWRQRTEGLRVDVAGKGSGLCLEVNRYLDGDRWTILHKILLDSGLLYYAEDHQVTPAEVQRSA